MVEVVVAAEEALGEEVEVVALGVVVGEEIDVEVADVEALEEAAG